MTAKSEVRPRLDTFSTRGSTGRTPWSACPGLLRFVRLANSNPLLSELMAKRAFLIGINRYQIPGADLRGCVNDVQNLRQALIDHCGFTANGIKTSLDFRATKKAMETGMQSLIGKAKRGDVILIHYSGHGSNVPDDDGDEADHRDEILCPTNLDWKDPLRDDWLRKTFDALPSGVNLTVIMDCCHSGTNTRAIEPPDAKVKERYLPSPWDLVAAESGRSLTGKVGGVVPGKRILGRKRDIVEANINEVLITGCRDTQTSADAYIGGSYNGALTYHLVKAIVARKGKLTCRELHEEASGLLRKSRYDQVPQLEGKNENFDHGFLESY